MAIAIALTTSNFLRPDPLPHPAYLMPDKQFCDGLNAPAAVIRFLLIQLCGLGYGSLPLIEFIIETGVYFSLVWLLWYLVIVESRGKGLSILASKTRFRKTVDLCAIAFGVLLLLLGGFNGAALHGNYGKIVSIPYEIWTLLILGFYGHDLWASLLSSLAMRGRRAS